MENAKIISMIQAAVNKEYDKMCSSIREGNETQELVYTYSFNKLTMLLIAIINSDEEDNHETD